MHGYQIMQELQERSRGAWQPSPGSIYPKLQQLTDEGLVSSSEEDGRKVFALTEAGQVLTGDTETPPPWEGLVGSDSYVELRDAAGSLMAASKQIGQVGTADQVAAATEILVQARKGLYQLLAE